MSSKRSSSSQPTSKPKKAFIQTNTIFNYFDSNQPVKPEPKPSNSITNYFKSQKTETPNAKPVKKESQSPLDDFKIQKKITTQSSLFNLKTEPKKELKPQSSLSNIKKYKPVSEQPTSSRKCPFYKRLEGTQITVDAFSYGDIENCNAYFLSHYHYDHFIGLKKDFRNKMFCSQITANLVMKNIKVDKQFITVLELDKFLNVYDDGSIQVALIDANHYLDSYYTFLPQEKIVALGVKVAQNELRAKPNTLIICGTYTIGKERIFIAIAEKLNVKVYVTRDKKNIIDCLDDERLNKMITRDPNETNLHVIQMGKLNIKDLEAYTADLKEYENIIAFKPSGWTHNASTENGLSIEKRTKNITIYGLEYSEHSSFEELKNCVTTLKPRKIIPTVNCGNKDKRDKMQMFLDEWLTTK